MRCVTIDYSCSLLIWGVGAVTNEPMFHVTGLRRADKSGTWQTCAAPSSVDIWVIYGERFDRSTQYGKYTAQRAEHYCIDPSSWSLPLYAHIDQSSRHDVAINGGDTAEMLEHARYRMATQSNKMWPAMNYRKALGGRHSLRWHIKYTENYNYVTDGAYMFAFTPLIG